MTLDRKPAHFTDMLGFVCELRSLIKSLSLADFSKNRVLCLAVEKLFINLGEAAYRLGEEASKTIPGMPWRQIIGPKIFWRMVTIKLLLRSFSIPSSTTCLRLSHHCGN